MAAILNSVILDSSTLQQKKLYSFILIHVIMAATWNSPIMD